MHEMRPSNPNVDPACFPLLHIRGTQGWRVGLRKRKYLTNEEKAHKDMEDILEAANGIFDAEVPIDLANISAQRGPECAEEMDEEEEMPIEDVRNYVLLPA